MSMRRGDRAKLSKDNKTARKLRPPMGNPPRLKPEHTGAGTSCPHNPRHHNKEA